MGIINRVINMVRANINEQLDQVENPIATIDQIMRQMSDVITLSNNKIIDITAQQKMVELDLKEAQNLSREWERKAELAAAKGTDDLIIECLARQRDYDGNAQ